MRPRTSHLQISDKPVDSQRRKASRSLQVTLWALWTLAVAGVAIWIWHAAASIQQPVSLLSLVIHCTLAGLVGLIVITRIEMWAEPWRFLGTGDRGQGTGDRG